MTRVSPASKQSNKGANVRGSTIRYQIRVCIFNLILAVTLIASSGDLSWAIAWIYTVVLYTNQLLVALLVIRKYPELAEERSQREPADEARWDRVPAGVVALWGPLLTLLVAGLDWRFIWSPDFPVALQFVGLVIIIVGSVLTIWAMASNRFFYGHVRIEEERGQAVVSSGPYQYVRHPGYLGALLFDLGTPVILSSLWALIPALLTAGVIFIRTALEDKLLLDRLDGFKDYTQRVRRRLLPGIW